MKRVTMTASDGMVLTNGETYGTEVYLGSGDSPDNWQEITVEAYQKIMEENTNETDHFY